MLQSLGRYEGSQTFCRPGFHVPAALATLLEHVFLDCSLDALRDSQSGGSSSGSRLLLQVGVELIQSGEQGEVGLFHSVLSKGGSSSSKLTVVRMGSLCKT
jgi:hypothetical protein